MQRKFFILTTTVILSLLCSLPALAISSYWQTANPLSDGDINQNGKLTLYGVYYSGSEVIAVGERGAILTGTNTNVGFNRVEWVARQSGLTIDLNDVIYDGSQYLAIGGRTNGVIVTSPDLVNWQTRIVGDNIRLRGIAYAQVLLPGSSSTSHYVVVGDNGGLLTSTDGTTWTTLDSGTGMPLLDVLWDDVHKQFIAVGGNTTTGIVLRSDDGETWDPPKIVGGHFLHDIVADGNGNLIIVGDAGTVVSSSDGVSWTQQSPPNLGYSYDLYGVAYSDTFNTYVAVGTGGTILYSNNGGSTWTPSTSGTGKNLFSVTWDGSHYVVVGTDTLLSPTDAGLSSWKYGISPISDTLTLTGIATDTTTDTSLAVTDNGDVYTSDNGLAWTQAATGTGHTFTAVAWDGSQYVAIDNGSDILTSTNGSTWTLQAAGVGNGLNGIAASGSAYVVVGDNDTLLVSSDLTTWTPKTWSPAGSIGDLAGVTFNAEANNNAGEFLVIANKVISTSPVQYDVTVLHSSSASGLTWVKKDPFLFSPTTPLTTPLNAAAWNGNQYVAVGPTGNILYSDDGNDWQHPERPDTIQTLNGISWAPALERFIAVGNSGTVVLSAGADMGVFMNAQSNSGTIATEFEPFGYSFTAINNGPFRATNVVMTVTLPAATDAEFTQFDTSRCSQSGQVLTCPLADMAGGGGVFTSIYVQITPLSPLVHKDLAVTVEATAAGPEALPNDNALTTATFVQSTEDKIAKDYNAKLGGTGRLDAAGLLVLALAVIPLWRRRRRHGNG